MVCWWFENWIVDASGWLAFGLAVCCIVSSEPIFEWVRVDRFVIV